MPDPNMEKLVQLEAKIDNIHLFLEKFDTTVTHLHELVVSVDKVLALQEQRIETYEKQMEVVHQRIHSVKAEYEAKLEKANASWNEDHKNLIERITNNEKELMKWKWLVMGGFGVLSLITTFFGDISAFFNGKG